MNTNFKVIGLAGLEIKPKSTPPEVNPLTTGHLSCYGQLQLQKQQLDFKDQVQIGGR